MTDDMVVIEVTDMVVIGVTDDMVVIEATLTWW